MTNVDQGQLRETRPGRQLLEPLRGGGHGDTLAEQLVFSKLPDSWKVGRIQTGADMTRLVG